MTTVKIHQDGPTITLGVSCSGCHWVHCERYRVQGDRGFYVTCKHPSLEEPKTVGDSIWQVPKWCPVLAKQSPDIRPLMVGKS